MKKRLPQTLSALFHSGILHSAFFLLHFAFRMSLLTSLRTGRYDPAGVGCYDFGHVLHATFGIKSELIGIKSFAAGGSFVKLP
jgi:hypothetical protein